jgi:hypothetical protein
MPKTTVILGCITALTNSDFSDAETTGEGDRAYLPQEGPF